MLSVKPPEFVPVPSGRVGLLPAGADAESQQCYYVNITRPFHMSKYLVTRDLWRETMKDNPWSDEGESNDGDYPATGRPRDEIVKFLERISHYVDADCHLPTEAQWAFACSARNPRSQYWSHSEKDEADEGLAIAHCSVRRRFAPIGNLSSVGKYPPNPFGLYDMLGLATEWMRDCYDMRIDAPYPSPDSFPAPGSVVNDYWHESGEYGIVRGSSYLRDIDTLTWRLSFLRPVSGPGDFDCGFRLVWET